jgi:hypothetical protein
MSFKIESLELKESYNFDVTVEDGLNHFAAKLDLTPEKVVITIMGECHDERNCSIGFGDIDRLICTDLNKKFILHKLRFIKSSSRTICRHPKHIGYFETSFEVEYVVFSPTGSNENNGFHFISIHSDAISKWIGNTNTQEEIVRAYHNKEPLFDDPKKLNEFLVKLDNIGALGVDYDLSMHSSSPDFSSGINFPPSFNMVFLNDVCAEELKEKFDKTYNLLSFFIGNDFLINRVEVGFSHMSFNRKWSLYYPTKNTSPKYDQGYNFFPLGINLRFDSLGLPPLPLDAFNAFFSLPQEKVGYWDKYLKYKRMSNVEERFLGFFRILEALCFKEKSYLDENLLSELIKRCKPYLIKKFNNKKNVTSFLKGLSRYNNSKYNTEKCIQDFYQTLPNSLLSKWKIEKSDIGSICKLRNDITHANDYYASEHDVEEKAKFIEVLLIISLCKIIGIDLAKTEGLINRIHGYHLIAKREV